MGKIITAVIGLAFLTAGLPAMAQKHGGMYCEKHCNITALKKEVRALEKSVEQDKAALKKGQSPNKGSYVEQKNRLKAHLQQHMTELEDLQKNVETMEKDLSDMESK